VSELQRARLLAGAVGAIEERGYANTTVAHITTRARVSRRTFYDLFANREECLAAVLDDVAGTVEGELTRAGLAGLPWRERVRGGLWAILAFLDRELALARVCVVEALRADQQVGGPLSRREELLARLAAVVDEGRRESPRGAHCSPLTAEGLVGAAFTIVHARLVRGEDRPLTDLTGELMGLIVLPYLGAAAARREHGRPAPAASPVPGSRGSRGARDPFEGLPLRLTYRTARVLEAVAQLGGRGADPSNRQVADHAGIQDPGQISKLLRRLEGLGLLANTGAGHAKGEPNAWALTVKGERVAQSVRLHVRREKEAA
jgi:AcrR family transcriptional regulator/DNA-binding MarR family transcriptional regulator